MFGDILTTLEYLDKYKQHQQKQQINKRHGGPFDRGSADKYYGRPFQPHYFTGATYRSDYIKKECMTEQEIAEYKAGWDDCNDKKDWGDCSQAMIAGDDNE